MRLLKPITITVTKSTLALQDNDTHEVMNEVAFKVLKTMLMHSDSMTFYTAGTYEDMCVLLRAVIFSNLNK